LKGVLKLKTVTVSDEIYQQLVGMALVGRASLEELLVEISRSIVFSPAGNEPVDSTSVRVTAFFDASMMKLITNHANKYGLGRGKVLGRALSAYFSLIKDAEKGAEILVKRRNGTYSELLFPEIEKNRPPAPPSLGSRLASKVSSLWRRCFKR
jgi:hypothetical protein